MRKHALLVALSGGFVAAAAAFVACSSSTAPASSVDGGHEVGPYDAGITVFETSSPDGGPPPPSEAGGHDGGRRDTGGSTGSCDATSPVAVDAGVLAACSGVTGACDFVSQNCSCGAECTIVGEPDGSYGTACSAALASEHLSKGAPCCPTDSFSTNPCDPGLECNGGNYCVDGGSPGPGLPPGWGGSRCTPHCCTTDAGGGSAICGTAGDGGVEGQCNLGISLVAGGPLMYSVCTYPQTCEPLHLHPCPSGFGCLVENAAGTSTCTVISNPNGDAGATEGQPCQYANACADGLVCVGPTAATSACAWMCYIAGQTNPPPPFDAGVIKTTPGYGGCPTGETCTGVDGFPDWLGSCSK